MTVELPELPEYWVWDVTRMAPWGAFRYVFVVSANHAVIKGDDYKVSSTVCIVNSSDVDREFEEAYRIVSEEAFKKVKQRTPVAKKIEEHLDVLGASPFLLEDSWYTERLPRR